MNFHIHIHSTPILSSYVSFSTRDVVWECRCGHRKLTRESRAYSSPFSLSWTCKLSKSDMQKVLDRKESKTLLTLLDICKKSHETAVVCDF